MATSSTIKLLCLAILGIAVVNIGPVTGQISCGTVARNVIPCLSYLQSGGKGQVPAKCCDGIKNLNFIAKSTADRQSVCNCLKDLAKGASNVGLAAGLPGKCGVSVPYKISTTTNCATVK